MHSSTSSQPERPPALVPDGIDDRHRNGVLEAEQASHEDGAVRPRTRQRHLHMISPRLGKNPEDPSAVMRSRKRYHCRTKGPWADVSAGNCAALTTSCVSSATLQLRAHPCRHHGRDDPGHGGVPWRARYVVGGYRGPGLGTSSFRRAASRAFATTVLSDASDATRQGSATTHPSPSDAMRSAG